MDHSSCDIVFDAPSKTKSLSYVAPRIQTGIKIKYSKLSSSLLSSSSSPLLETGLGVFVFVGVSSSSSSPPPLLSTGLGVFVSGDCVVSSLLFVVPPVELVSTYASQHVVY